ncbi:acyl-CoA-binding domain-containing protein 4 isoform X2 [Cucumis melo var. makuwa]|uniref:Acyl-CoA-binding domain-containing protein 4 isoform X2 n=1 Tax=Cucumis melo var. makuwa TaxID=1194695 RepID=A0A5A7UJ40_CUCMM|nr:acyl-CoA-binding domain-containing protein 4 isoform X2 [Cucumis melo var. makuwa]
MAAMARALRSKFSNEAALLLYGLYQQVLPRVLTPVTYRCCFSLVEVLDLRSWAWTKLEAKTQSPESPPEKLTPCAGHSLGHWEAWNSSPSQEKKTLAPKKFALTLAAAAIANATRPAAPEISNRVKPPHAAPCLQPELVAPLRSERGISSVGARALQPLSRDLVAWKKYCLAVRTRQVNLQHVVVMTRTVMAVRRVSRWRVVVPAWVSFGITTYLGLCGPTGHQSSMDIDMTRVTRWGPRIPIVLGVPRGTKDQSYVSTGAHVACVRERARDWVKDEASAKASWQATRSDRGEP